MWYPVKKNLGGSEGIQYIYSLYVPLRHNKMPIKLIINEVVIVSNFFSESICIRKKKIQESILNLQYVMIRQIYEKLIGKILI